MVHIYAWLHAYVWLKVFTYNTYLFLLDAPMLNNSSDNIILIGGVVGGIAGGVILLLIITGILCIVCIRRPHMNIVTVEHTRTVIVDHIYNTIDSRVPATPVPSYDVPRKTSEDGRNFVQLNEQSYGERNKRNTNNPPTYEESTGEDRVIALSTTSDIRAHQSSSDDTPKEYDYAYAHVHAHDDQPLHNTGVNAKISADHDQEQGFYMKNIHVHSLKSPQPNTVYGVVTQPKSDGFDNAEGQIHASLPLHTNSDEPNGGYGVVNQHKSDDPNL